jgi:hypothetical protein
MDYSSTSITSQKEEMEQKKKEEKKKEEEDEEEEYFQSLTKEESKTLEIARSHLESSFHLRKSIGFIKWREKKGQKK